MGVNTSTVLDAGEMVLEVQVPEPRAGARSAFIKFAMRKSIDFPVVNCAATVTSDEGVVGSRKDLPQLRLRPADAGHRGRAVPGGQDRR